ncbi:MAG: ACT domain-containing protein [Eubacteriaceae bacterium]|jgi:chorismate mutase|nr:ACT domain-containing protein [Eubacteriaceae bacterium]
MEQEYLIVNKKILPDYFSKVLKARNLLETAQCRSVSEAVKQVGISRSTYYKYKDYIFAPSDKTGLKMTLALSLSNRKGVLSDVLNTVNQHHCNIITIHQDIPIHQSAYVTLTLDGLEMTTTVEELIGDLTDVEGVNSVNLVTMQKA